MAKLVKILQNIKTIRNLPLKLHQLSTWKTTARWNVYRKAAFEQRMFNNASEAWQSLQIQEMLRQAVFDS